MKYIIFSSMLSFCLLSGGSAGQAMATTLEIMADDVVSLANAPEVLEASGVVDEAGRPVLTMDLRFANGCYRDAGAKIDAVTVDGAGYTAIITQNFPADGCPDIFQPAEQRISVLLPSDWTNGGIKLVAKPAGTDRMTIVSLDGSPQGRADRIIEARSEGIYPAISVKNVSRAAGTYKIKAQLIAEGGCIAKPRAVLYEVPDDHGMPVHNVLLLTASGECADHQDAEVTISITENVLRDTIHIINETGASIRQVN